MFIGDFNYWNINWDSWSTASDNVDSEEYKFLKSVQDAYLFQHINKPTRWRGDDEPHILDLLMTNESDMISELKYHSPLGKSDHCVLQFQYQCYTILKTKNKVAKQYGKTILTR